MDINLHQYLKGFQQYWWLIPAIVLLSVGLGLAYSLSQTPLYEAKATLIVSSNQAIDDTGDFIDSFNTLARNTSVAITACEILESQTIQDQAALLLGIPVETVSLYRTGCVVLPDSTVLQLRVQGRSPELAADLANTIGAKGIIYISNLYEVVDLQLLDPAEADKTPVSPNHLTNVTLSAIIGLAGAVGFIVLRETLLQFWGYHSSSGSLSPSPVTNPTSPFTLAVITLKPMTDLHPDEHNQKSNNRIHKQLAEQVQKFIQQKSRVSDSVLYLEKKQFVILMPQTSKQEAVTFLTTFMDQLRAKTFTVPGTDVAVAYVGVGGIVESENNLLVWRSLLKRGQEAAQKAGRQGDWQIYVD